MERIALWENIMMIFFTASTPETGEPEIQSMILKDDGTFPNNEKLPLIFMQNAFDPNTRNLVGTIEKTFHGNGWGSSWRNGLYNFHHYHSTAHEVLGLYSGWVKAHFGGPQGKIVDAKIGDVIIVPAGVSHKNLEQSTDFRCVGAYPKDQSWDMNYGRAGERPQTDVNIKNVSPPKTDPVFGKSGPVKRLWE